MDNRFGLRSTVILFPTSVYVRQMVERCIVWQTTYLFVGADVSVCIIICSYFVITLVHLDCAH